jgi:hypothetical protein
VASEDSGTSQVSNLRTTKKLAFQHIVDGNVGEYARVRALQLVATLHGRRRHPGGRPPEESNMVICSERAAVHRAVSPGLRR